MYRLPSKLMAWAKKPSKMTRGQILRRFSFVLLAALAFNIVYALAFPYVRVALLTRQGFEGQAVLGHVWEDDRLRIVSDPGGEVFHRMAYAQWLERKGTQISVTDLCASACTFHLRNPNLCAAPGSLWMFHRSFLLSGPPPWYAKAFISAADAFHARIYPDGLREWIQSVEAQMGPNDELWIVGQDLIDKGWLTACEGEGWDVDKARFVARELSNGFEPHKVMPAFR